MLSTVESATNVLWTLIITASGLTLASDLETTGISCFSLSDKLNF